MRRQAVPASPGQNTVAPRIQGRRWLSRCLGISMVLVVSVSLLAGRVFAQGLERLTFQQAIDRAVAGNPTIGQASAGIMRAEAILQQLTAVTRPSINATLTTNTIAPVTRFSGASIVPRAQTLTLGTVSVPVLTPVAWAVRGQAADNVLVSQQTVSDVRKQVAVAAAQSYLAIIASRRVLELNERARDNAKAHFDFANQRFQGGIGSRLNMLRAQQEMTSDEARVEEARLAIRRAQEALGVLVAADGPVDAADEPVFDPAVEDLSLTLDQRTDVHLLSARQSAAQRVANDSWKYYLPSVTAEFSPQLVAPAGLFANSRSWRGSLLLNMPIFDSGFRGGFKTERIALLNSIKFERANVERQATSEIRTAREAVASTERAAIQARQAADQANEVLRITDVAFREGATTNIEVLDAQRQARDTETQAVISDDAVRRARLELLVALGRFPQ